MIAAAARVLGVCRMETHQERTFFLVTFVVTKYIQKLRSVHYIRFYGQNMFSTRIDFNQSVPIVIDDDGIRCCGEGDARILLFCIASPKEIWLFFLDLTVTPVS